MNTASQVVWPSDMKYVGATLVNYQSIVTSDASSIFVVAAVDKHTVNIQHRDKLCQHDFFSSFFKNVATTQAQQSE